MAKYNATQMKYLKERIEELAYEARQNPTRPKPPIKPSDAKLLDRAIGDNRNLHHFTHPMTDVFIFGSEDAKMSARGVLRAEIKLLEARAAHDALFAADIRKQRRDADNRRSVELAGRSEKITRLAHRAIDRVYLGDGGEKAVAEFQKQIAKI